MNYLQAQADPRQHLVGLCVVALLHVIVVYALVSGLAQKVVEVVRAPIETKVIEEIKDTPPPPEVIPPPPVLEAPPPFIPPPEITISTPPPPPAQPPITVSTPTPPPAPEAFQPTPPPVVAAPPPPPAVAQPTAVAVGVACPVRPAPKLTPKLETIAGVVRAKLTIKGGKVTNVDILSSTPRGAFDGVVRAALLQYVCQPHPDGVTQVAEQAFEFRPE